MTDGRLHTIVVVFVGAIVLLSVSAPAVAATTTPTEPNVTFVESGIATDTTWTPADGPYRIIQDIEVEPGATLTVEPGTRIEIAENITVSVSGSFRTNGTAARPVEITRSDGAAADRRWESLQYNGTDRSFLKLHHTTLEGGTAGVTVASSEGTVEVVDSTMRDFTTAGLEVTETTASPRITVRRSTFRTIGDHAIQASPGAGTTDRVSLTATPDTIGANADHTLTLQPGAGVSLDSIHVEYRSDGSVASVGSEDIERIGLDRDRDGSIERSFAGSVASVSATEAQLEISLSGSVEIPSEGQLIVEYGNAVNPTTRGIYPVEVQLREESVSQLSAGVEAPFVVGDVTSPTDVDMGPDQPATRVRGLAVLDSTFREIDGAGVFVDADRVRRIQASRNRIDGTAGSGITVRAERSESYFWSNEITDAEDGIRVRTSGATSVTANENRIRDTQTGIRVRQSDRDRYPDGDITLRRNTLANNAVNGVDIRGWSLDVTVEMTNNSVRENGREGIFVSGWMLQGGEISGNEIVGNADTGVSIRTDIAARTLTIDNNTITDSGGHGLDVQSGLLVYGSDLTENQLTNNAGAGLVVSSPVTHRANLSVANNVVAANTYGMVLQGVMGTTVRDNAIVFNTNRFADPVRLPDVEPGTGSYVAAGEAGVILNQANSEVPPSELVSNPAIDDQLSAVTVRDGIVAVLRTDGASYTRTDEASALTIRQVSDDIPTGIGITKTGTENSSYRFTENGLYGQHRGLTVDVAPFITSNTTAAILTESTRTVHAESNYWGSRHGPYHSSILPEGEGNSAVTERGWVDFVPFRDTPPDPEYTRPTAAIDTPTNSQPGEDVQLSGRNSTSTHGSIVRYRYQIDGTAQPVIDRPRYTFEMPDQRVEVGLIVEDNLGIESNSTKTTIEPQPATPSTATPVTTATTPASTPPPDDSSPTLLGSLGSIWGLLGGVCYLLALVSGLHGMALTVTNRSPPIDGLRIQALAALGVLVWIVAGLFGSGPLLTIGITAAVAWGVLTGLAYVIATRRLLGDVLR
ncbi:right-handed parallel beta-helix repeat-containing protein [Halobellus rarus]|uniref:Right-handed parallel beta-helix repeat-containing protein n=1 Tax=Halobellus rarus TaxID=1126237 RepID=A0ABD6CLP5_9EURY